MATTAPNRKGNSSGIPNFLFAFLPRPVFHWYNIIIDWKYFKLNYDFLRQQVQKILPFYP